MAREPFNRIWTETPTIDDFDEPTNIMWEEGWRGGPAEEPPEAFAQNWWQNRADIALRQLERDGAMEWLSDVPYEKWAYAKGSDGNVYRAVQSSTNANPTIDDGTNWIAEREQSPLGFLLAPSGYYSLPGGLIIQWAVVGDGSSISVDTSESFGLPINFPFAAFGAIATIKRGAAVTENWGCYADVTTSQVTVAWDSTGTSGSISKRAFIIALGV